MPAGLVFAGLAALVVVVAWRPHGWGPALGAAVGVGLAASAGVLSLPDLQAALSAQWRAYATLASVMVITSAADNLGLLERLASRIEPRTRGPVRHAFRVTFILSALVAAVLSNDAAILLMTPTVIVLLRTVYPRRHPKFVAPFAIAVFAAAGVAPLVISNPMNMVFADHVGLPFNRYSVTMIPVAVAGWVTTYLVLSWVFRDVLSDADPALGAWPRRPPSLGWAERVTLATVIAVLAAYPIVAYLDLALWPVAVAGGAICALVSRASGRSFASLGEGVAWALFPFLTGVFLLAVALDRVGVVGWLRALYGSRPPIVTIGVTSALGSALINNHPMSVLNAFALEGAGDAAHFAALIGGDLGPRLLPVGSLASLIWYAILRKHEVTVSLWAFVRTGIILTVPTLAVSLAVLWLLGLALG